VPLNSEIVEFLERRAAAGLPDVWEAPVEILRKNLANRPLLSGEPEKIYEVEHKFIAGPTAELPIRIYRPHWHKPLPALIYYCGGGWVLNSLDIYEQACRSLANKGQFIVIAVNYQKAPEHPFPIPFDDSYATLLWARDNADALGIDPNQIGVAGDSAGGNLAACVALKARDTGDINLAFQALIYPCNDPEMNYESAKTNGVGLNLSTKAMKTFWDMYLQKKSDRKNPYASPFAAKDLSNLPPTILITAEYDPLLDDGYNYAQLLKQNGVTTIYYEYPGMIHGFFSLAGVTPVALEAQQRLADEINALIFDK
jgi:acetyl esterase